MASTRSRRRKQPPPPPKIYVASLADHDAGQLHGIWLDATIGVADLLVAIKNMLTESPSTGAEEWAILDCEGFHDIVIDPHDLLELVHELAIGIASEGAAFAAWYRRFRPESPHLTEQFRAVYLGEHWGSEGYVESLYDCEIQAVYHATRWSPLSAYIHIDVTPLAQCLVERGELVVIEPAGWGPSWVFRGLDVPIEPQPTSRFCV